MCSDKYDEILQLYGERITDAAKEFCRNRETLEKEFGNILPIQKSLCQPVSYEDNILNKIAVISPEKLKRGCINSANQIILITGGFGASSNSRGQKVYAKNIASGENEVWTRQDIMGIISFDNLPLWAQNKLQQMKNLEHSEDAEHRKKELVYVGSNPYCYVDRLNNSIPYLVPRASVLLQDIGRSFFDSLQVKGIPLHKIIVTSVLRTKADVEKLRSKNGNATQNSCHLYGTTFDVCYNRYKTVEDPDGPRRRQVRNDTLKWVLSEVLNDARKQNKCLVKYEVKQGCFHITVK